MCTPSPTITQTGEPSVELSAIPSRIPTGEPSSHPSLVPTATPSRSPTGEPSSFPSVAPSGEPSSAPSVVPSNAPTLNPTPCGKNDWTFKVDNKQKQGCSWVGKAPYERCLPSTGAKEHCKETCCGIDGIAPDCPTDWDYKHQGKDGRGCKWVADLPESRCYLEGAKEACGACCDIEVHEHDGDSHELI